MRIISRKILREFWNRPPEAEPVLRAWYADVKQADCFVGTHQEYDRIDAACI